MNPWYLWVRARQLEGTLDQGPEVGVWGISTGRILKGWGCPESHDYPVDSHSPWPLPDVAGADDRAKPHRILCYQMIRDSADARAALRDPFHPGVVASFEITSQWFTATDGIIDYPATGPVVGSHGIALAEYSDKVKKFAFINSWGEDWGHGGYGLLGSDYFDAYFVEGYAWHRLPYPTMDFQPGVNFLRYAGRGLNGSIIHACEAYDRDRDDYLGWAFVVERGGSLELEELFVKPDHRRRGYGTRICRMIEELRADTGFPLRAWISHADSYPDRLANVDWALGKLGLTRRPSGKRWASYVGTVADGASPRDDLQLEQPSRPRAFHLGNR